MRCCRAPPPNSNWRDLPTTRLASLHQELPQQPESPPQPDWPNSPPSSMPLAHRQPGRRSGWLLPPNRGTGRSASAPFLWEIRPRCVTGQYGPARYPVSGSTSAQHHSRRHAEIQRRTRRGRRLHKRRPRRQRGFRAGQAQRFLLIEARPDHGQQVRREARQTTHPCASLVVPVLPAAGRMKPSLRAPSPVP